MTHLKVAVRVRPLSQRELTLNSSSIIGVCEKSIDIINLKVPEQNAGDSRQRTRRFNFDHCFSTDSTQEEVFDIIGSEIEKALKSRYHSCILAYGQSSTGKTYTMMGTSSEPGVTPRICNKIFSYIQETAIGNEQLDCKTSVSYLEIYNEKVRDLLAPQNDSSNKIQKHSLRVREHPKKGPYVQGLSEHEANNSETLLKWLNVGNSNRRVAATTTNPNSSRSHSVFTLTCLGGIQVHLVDLAGSERAGTRCPTASILKEGANINKSLVALGNVISTLADHSTKLFRSNNRKRFVPYRDSILTWLLKDTLGGNSRTVMVATVSPSNACYSETVNTLRFGQRAKQIVSQPVVNEDPKERTIRELREEIAKLKELLLSQTQINAPLSEDIKPLTTSQDFQNPSPPNQQNDDQKSISELPPPHFDLIETKDNSKLPDTYKLSNIHSNTHITYPDFTSTKNTCDTYHSQEELIPLITVKSSVVQQEGPNCIVYKTKMDKRKSKSLGSHEQLSSPSTSKSDKNKKTVAGQKRTLDKSHTLTKLSLRKSQENVSKSETNSETAKKSAGPRKDIIASVTNRLYASSKKKDAEVPQTQTPTQASDETSKEDAIINAKVKLLELTRRALKAHRRKNAEIQTDIITVTRVKDVCTDVDDLQVQLVEIKEVGTEMDVTTYADVGVYCSPLLDTFDQQSNEAATNTSLILTRSCGTQSLEEIEVPKGISERKSPTASTGPFSFTKYLQGTDAPDKKNSNDKTFTSSLNISVTSRDSNGKALADNTSDDSLDDWNQLQVCFPTPDLISNHNSLETHAHTNAVALKNESPRIEQGRKKTEEISSSSFPSLINENFAIATETCVANCTVTADIKDKIQSINVTTLYSPEICTNRINNETVKPLRKNHPQRVNPNITEVENNLATATIRHPQIFKSVVKQDYLEKIKTESDVESNTENLGDSAEINSKKFRFNSSSLKNEKKVIETMGKFLEEATKLMTNLTRVASTMETNCQNSYDIRVTVNDEPPSAFCTKRKSERRLKKRHHSTSTQTFSNTENTSVQTSDGGSIINLNNRYESILKESCDKMERCVNFALEKSERTKTPLSFERDEVLHRFPQPFTCHPAEWNLAHLGGEDSSLESNPTFSDYGSLPRQKRPKRPVPSSSPSAYLRQLMRIRRQIVETSREDLMQERKEDSF